MAVRIEKHGKLIASMKIEDLLKAGTNKKKAAKVNRELARRNYITPVLEELTD